MAQRHSSFVPNTLMECTKHVKSLRYFTHNGHNTTLLKISGETYDDHNILGQSFHRLALIEEVCLSCAGERR